MAREKTEWILENHEPEPLPEDKQAELNQIVLMAQQELGKECKPASKDFFLVDKGWRGSKGNQE